MSEFDQTFGRVVVINLDSRVDRMTEFREMLRITDWPFPEPMRFRAVDGRKAPPPAWWQVGWGAWGCLMSHARVLENALHENIESLLVLEDDALIPRSFRERVEAFLSSVPNDWDMLYFGGQHLSEPLPVSENVVRCVDVNRTHAYAVRRPFISTLYQAILNAPDYIANPRHHVDHRIGQLCRTHRHNIYAPRHFLIGQRAGRSDVSGSNDDQRTWNRPGGEHMNSEVVFFTMYDEFREITGPLHRECRKVGLKMRVIRGPRNWRDGGALAIALRSAPFVFVWHGADLGCEWVIRFCRRHHVPMAIVDWGLIERAGWMHVDPNGLYGDSSLCESLDWVAEEDFSALAGFRRSYLARTRYRTGGRRDGPVIVALQKAYSSGVQLHSDFGTMQEVVEHVASEFPGKDIYVCPHPQEAPEVKGDSRVAVIRGRPTMELVQDASCVVSVSSRILLEALLIGVQVRALGDCPARVHAGDSDRLLAACLARQRRLVDGDVASLLAAVGLPTAPTVIGANQL